MVSLVLTLLVADSTSARPDLFDEGSTLDANIPVEDLELGRNVVEFIRPGMLQKRSVRSGRTIKSGAARSSQDSRKPTIWVAPSSTRTKKASPSTETRQRENLRVARRSRRLPRATSKSKQPSAKTQAEDRAIPVEVLPVPRSAPYSGFVISAENLPPLTRGQRQLRDKIRRVLSHYYNRPLNTRDRSPWEILHAVLSFETHSKVLAGGPQGKPITAVGWLCFNQSCKRRTLMYVNRDDELRVRVGPALQGHQGQLLAMFAQSKVKSSYPMRVDDRDFTIADLIEMEKKTCYPRTELTFKLISLMHYLDSEATWINDRGMQWDIPKLIQEELRQPVRGAACGGTHRLGGLTLAYKTRERRGEPVDGQYLRAKKFVAKYQRYAYRLQNSDGSFSTEWFRGEGHDPSIDRRLKTTGHTLELLLYAATEKELKHRQTVRAVNYLANLMYNNRYKDWESGPLGHAIHALLLYDRMVFAAYDEPASEKSEENIAKGKPSSASNRRR